MSVFKISCVFKITCEAVSHYSCLKPCTRMAQEWQIFAFTGIDRASLCIEWPEPENSNCQLSWRNCRIYWKPGLLPSFPGEKASESLTQTQRAAKTLAPMWSNCTFLYPELSQWVNKTLQLGCYVIFLFSLAFTGISFIKVHWHTYNDLF